MEPQASLIIGDMQVQLWAARTLADYYRPGGDQEARRRGWLKALLGIVEPWMGEGRPVPVGEIVVDLRWGIRADAGGPLGLRAGLRYAGRSAAPDNPREPCRGEAASLGRRAGQADVLCRSACTLWQGLSVTHRAGICAVRTFEPVTCRLPLLGISPES